MNETEIDIFKTLCSKGNTPEEANEVIREMRNKGM
jgi:pentatricopeptide repeat protein